MSVTQSQIKQPLFALGKLVATPGALELPANPLDQLVNHFGESNVAELTGRTRRLMRDSRSGRVEYRKRAPEGLSMDKVNVYEMAQFHKGQDSKGQETNNDNLERGFDGDFAARF